MPGISARGERRLVGYLAVRGMRRGRGFRGPEPERPDVNALDAWMPQQSRDGEFSTSISGRHRQTLRPRCVGQQRYGAVPG